MTGPGNFEKEYILPSISKSKLNLTSQNSGQKYVLDIRVWSTEQSGNCTGELTLTFPGEVKGSLLWPVSVVFSRVWILCFQGGLHVCFDEFSLFWLQQQCAFELPFFFLVKKKINPSLTFLNASLLLLFNWTNQMSSNGKFSLGYYLNDYYYWMPLNLC